MEETTGDGLFPDGDRGLKARQALSVETWPGIGALVSSRCVLTFVENSDGEVDSGLASPQLGLSSPVSSLPRCISLSRMESQSPGASLWVAMWASTASPTSWSASQSLRASASTSSVWVSSWPDEGAASDR